MNGIAGGIVRIFESVVEERDRAMRKWGVQSHPDGTKATPFNESVRDAQRSAVDALAKEGKSNWYDILMEEVLEVSCETDLDKLDAELNQVMQVCTVWREHIQRRQAGEVDPVAISAGGEAQGGYITIDQLNMSAVKPPLVAQSEDRTEQALREEVDALKAEVEDTHDQRVRDALEHPLPGAPFKGWEGGEPV